MPSRLRVAFALELDEFAQTIRTTLIHEVDVRLVLDEMVPYLPPEVTSRIVNGHFVLND